MTGAALVRLDMHHLPGTIGHVAVITSFIFALLSAFAFWRGTQAQNTEDSTSWARLGRLSFVIHGVAVVSIVVSLFTIIYNHYYEYHYAWSHSSNDLPTHYMISCFWEGQEGSFLLWIFWHVVLGVIVLATNKQWQLPVMAVFALVQAFLCSMILGIGTEEFKIGSSPFILMRDAMPDVPIFQMNPDYIPENGRGLNPLLQNYWMVIHPPTLFLGFAMTLVPFAYAIAGLWKKQFDAWVRPALPWSLAGALILGVGILMGAYWAYETLNFGGYWNWDPVENAVYIPWLVLVAAIHTLIAYRKGGVALRISFVLVIMSFVLVLYATFLTRSGILGNASVHSFTDLGLSGQLLIYLLAFVFLSLALLVWNWKSIPVQQRELDLYNRDTWIFLGVTVLCLASFQVLVTTSIPVYNSIANGLGIGGELAPPADPIQHYTMWQMWFMVCVAVLSAIGQLFWWKKPTAKTLFEQLVWPASISLVISTAFIVFGKVQDVAYMVLIVAASFSIATNASIMWGLTKTNMKLSGGAITHIGVALMLIGVLFSSAYSNVVSLNQSGLVYRKEFSTEMNRDNVLLWRETPLSMGAYELTYKGNALEVAGFPRYVKKEYLIPTADPFKMMVTTGNLEYNGKTYFKVGDTVTVRPENTYYAIEYRHVERKDTFVLFPRAQINPNMGLLASPDIKHFWGKDLYTHVSSVPNPEEEHEWSEPQEYKTKIGDTLFVNDYVAQLIDVVRITPADAPDLPAFDAGVKAVIRVLGRNETYIAEPRFLIRGNEVSRAPQEIGALGVRLTMNDIDPETGTFSIGVSTRQKDWVIMKAMEKPLINILWIGTGVLILGFGMAIRRRYADFVKMRNKGLEWEINKELVA